MARLHSVGGMALAGRGLGRSGGAERASPPDVCHVLSDAMLGGLLDRAQFRGRVQARELMSVVLWAPPHSH